MSGILTFGVPCFALGILAALWITRIRKPIWSGAPKRIRLQGRTYRLAAVSGTAWTRECHRDDSLTYTYYPDPAPRAEELTLEMEQ